MPDPKDIDDILDAAISAHGARDLDLSETLCRDILAALPDQLDTLNLLGVIMQDRGRVQASIPILLRAIEIDPDFAEAFANLARGYHLAGDHEKAVATARRAIELGPELGEGWQQLGFALTSLEQWEEGLAALQKAIHCMTDDLDLHLALGFLAEKLGKPEVEVEAWRQVLRFEPDRLEVTIKLGIALTELGQTSEAIDYLKRAIDRSPGDTRALLALARALHRRFDGDELVSVCRQILAVDPGQLDAMALLSSGLIWLGRFDELKDASDNLLAAHPEKAWFAKQIGAVVPGRMEIREIAVCHAELNDESLPELRRVAAGYALGKALDRSGNYDAAFNAFRTTNALLHARSKLASASFDLPELRAYVTNTCLMFPREIFTSLRPLGNPSKLPVFVVGMMRTGTTLVEQIAASHPLVFGAGERHDILELVTKLNRGSIFVSPTYWDAEEARQSTADHISELRVNGGGASRVIDKLPANIQLLGQIRVLFPHAQIIICRRDLRDVCFSCFTTHFGEHIPWCYDLEECASRNVEIDRITRHFLAELPGPVLEMHYESLVRDPEVESRRLIDFLGLDWDPACLEFHKTKRLVTTASAWQVRQPVYDSSIGRWMNYKEHLGPMLKILEPYIADHESPATTDID